MADLQLKWKVALATLGGGALLHLVLAACGQPSSSVAQCQTGNCAGGPSGGGGSLSPSGAIIAFGGSSPPDGWLACDGSAVSRTQYASLFAAIGTASGSGDGSTTFNVPDYQGRFLRGVDHGAGRDPDAALRTAANPGGNVGDQVGSIEGDAFATHNHVLSDLGHGHGVNEPPHSHPITDQPHGHGVSVSGSSNNGVWAGFPPSGGNTACFNTGNPPYCYANGWIGINQAFTNINHTENQVTGLQVLQNKANISLAPAGASKETRPANAGVVWIIKT